MELANQLAAHIYQEGEDALPNGVLREINRTTSEHGLRLFYENLVGQEKARKLQSSKCKERGRVKAKITAAQNEAAVAAAQAAASNGAPTSTATIIQ